MKYMNLIGKYIWVFVGAVLFGIAAVKIKSAQRSENKQAQKVREAAEANIAVEDKIIEKNVDKLKSAQAHTKKVKNNAIKTLDNIAKQSGSVGSLLDDYNRDRLSVDPRAD